MNQSYKPNEIENYSFGDTTAAAGFDPDSQGRNELVPGTHRFRVQGWGSGDREKPAYELYPDQTARWQGQEFTVNKLLVRFRCSDGPCRNSITFDFIPIPGAGRPLLCVAHQNQCGQFFKALGFDLPPGQYLPAGFSLPMLGGRECMIKVIHQRDASKQPKFNDDGTPQLGPDFFGYSRVGSVPASVAPVSSVRPANGLSTVGASRAYGQAAAPVAVGSVADIDL